MEAKNLMSDRSKQIFILEKIGHWQEDIFVNLLVCKQVLLVHMRRLNFLLPFCQREK